MTAVNSTFGLVASLQKHDAMCELFFTHLADRLPLQIVQYGKDDVAMPLGSASVLFVIRGLFEFGNLVACAKRLGLPVYYFLDDNFVLIREERTTTLYDRYTLDAVRAALTDYEGVLLASGPLIDYFTQHRLHHRLMFYPPVAGRRVHARSARSNGPLTIAFFGGGHRRQPFADYVYPAVRRVGEMRAVRLIAVGVERGAIPDSPGLEVITPPYNPAYAEAISHIAGFEVDILVHPSNVSSNNIYKNPHVLINANAIGAVPLFSNTAPYAELPGLDPALLVDNTAEAWFAALSRLAGSAAWRGELTAAVARLCEAEFSGGRNVEIIERLLQSHPVPQSAAQLTRRLSAAACLGYGHVRTRLERRLGSGPT